MSIATEITRLQGIKSDIRTALVTQGIATASSHNMADFSADILAIQGGSEGVYITVKCNSAYQGYDIILSANESELDRKQCPSSLVVNFFVSADDVTLPATFTISNSLNSITQIETASIYGWYEVIYNTRTYLIKDGVWNTDLLGKYKINSYLDASVRINNSAFIISGQGKIYATKLFDFTAFTKLCANADGGTNQQCILNKTNTDKNDIPSDSQVLGISNASTKTQFTKDITDISGDYYFSLRTWAGTCNVYDVWLE